MPPSRILFPLSSHWIKVAYRQIETSMVRKMSGAWYNKCFSLLWRASSSGMYLLLSSSAVLKSCFHLQKLSTKFKRLARNFNSFQIEDHFFFRYHLPGVLGFVSGTWEDLSLRLVLCEVAMVAFLFHVAETNFYGVVLEAGSTWLFVGSLKTSLPANSGIPRIWWCDEKVRGTRPCKIVHKIIFLTRLGVTK